MELFHFTGPRNLRNILAVGLKPFANDEWNKMLKRPSLPVVWLTTASELRPGRPIASADDIRLTITLDRSDSRLVRWADYFLKHGLWAIESLSWEYAREHFYVYFGSIPRRRISEIVWSAAERAAAHRARADRRDYGGRTTW
jgi:hypothetical protein